MDSAYAGKKLPMVDAQLRCHAKRDVWRQRLSIPAPAHKCDIDRKDLDVDPQVFSVSLRTPGTIYKDLLIIGSNPGEGPQLTAPGHIRAFDVRTGKRQWIFHTIPHPNEPGFDTWSVDSWQKVGAANCWGGLSLDEQRGLVIFGTGSAAYDHYGGNRLGDNLYANCVIALKAATGQYVWHYQVVHHDLWDYDVASQPTLLENTRVRYMQVRRAALRARRL